MFALVIVFFVVAAIIAVVVLVSAVASVVSVVHALLPVAKVPVRYNLRNLQVRWLTSLATACAFTVVIFLLTFMLAFVKGMDRLTETSGRAGNVMVLADGANDESFSYLPPASVEELPSDLQAAIQKGPDGKYLATKEVYVIVTHTIPNAQPGGRQRRFVQMRGLDNVRTAADVHQIELDHGEWFTPSGVREVSYQDNGTTIKTTAPEVVLGNGVAKTFGADLGKPTLLPGDVVQIGPRRWYVSGIMKETNSSFGSEIWALDTPVQETFGRRNSYSSFVVRTKEEKIGSEAAKKLKENRSGQRLVQRSDRAGILCQDARDQRSVSLRHHVRGHHSRSRRRLGRDEHDVRRHQSAHQRHRRHAAIGLHALSDIVLVPGGVAAHRAGGGRAWTAPWDSCSTARR